MIESKLLEKLLRDFNRRGYADAKMASETVKYMSNGKGGLILTLKNGIYTYEDEFYGGQPYSGNETIWESEVPVFRCVYWGSFFDKNSPEDFLRKALAMGPSGNCVHRGPESYIEGDLEYKNRIIGNSIGVFSQTEEIYRAGKMIYIAYFVGGIINFERQVA